MRIVAGAARGRRLTALPGALTRPTSDRAREGLFSTVEALQGTLAGARVLDLYAGSGAVGLEALSRGAAHVLLVESHPRAVRVVHRNVAAVGLPGAQVRPVTVERLLPEGPGPGGPYDLVVADPPYAMHPARLQEVLSAVRRGWLAGGALVVVERSRRDQAPPWPRGYEALRCRRYGEGVLWYGRAVPTLPLTEEPTP